MLRAIDLCVGAGGWLCAARGLPIHFVAAADWAADCLETVAINHAAAHPGLQLIQADLSTPEGMGQILAAAGEVDLVVGAIPCEQLSTARANRPLKPGELEAVHALIDQCFGAIRQLRPRWWVFEDVVAVEGHIPPPIDCGLPYECRRIQAAEYGPQKRLRTFFGSFPPPAAPELGPRVLADVLRSGPYRTLPQLARYQRSKSKWYGQGGVKKCRVQDPGRAGSTVISSQGGCGSNAERSGMVPVDRICGTRNPVADPEELSPAVADASNRGAGCQVPLSRDDARRICDAVTEEAFSIQDREAAKLARVQDASQPSPTIASFSGRHERAARVPSAQGWLLDCAAPVAAITGGYKDDPREVLNGDLIRVLEWQEAALLQGFPESYIFAASWSQTWKLCAQAIPIQVGRAILRAVVEEWEVGNARTVP